MQVANEIKQAYTLGQPREVKLMHPAYIGATPSESFKSMRETT